MIEEYRFGSITISGKTYDYDIEVRWTGEVLSWRRQESHVINIEDVKRAIKESPEIIIIGTGESAMAKVLEKAKEEILSKEIGLIIEKTERAINNFNEEKNKDRKVIGLFHLTC